MRKPLPIRRLILLPLLYGLLIAGPAGTAAAQGGGPPASYEINITRAGTTCSYEIVGQSDQDRFRIAPAGTVLFQAAGTDALFVMRNDEAKNIRATPQGQVNGGIVRDGVPSPRSVRGPLPPNSEHNQSEHVVFMQCCDFRGGRCENLQEALPIEPSQGDAGAGFRRPNLSRRGPSPMDSVPAPAPAIRPAVPDGPAAPAPVMEIDG